MSLKTATVIAFLSQVISWVLYLIPRLDIIKLDSSLFAKSYYNIANTINMGGLALFFAVLYFKQKKE